MIIFPVILHFLQIITTILTYRIRTTATLTSLTSLSLRASTRVHDVLLQWIFTRIPVPRTFFTFSLTTISIKTTTMIPLPKFSG